MPLHVINNFTSSVYPFMPNATVWTEALISSSKTISSSITRSLPVLSSTPNTISSTLILTQSARESYNETNILIVDLILTLFGLLCLCLITLKAVQSKQCGGATSAHVENIENTLFQFHQPDEPEVLIDVERQQTSPTSSAQEPHSANITIEAVLQSAPSQNLFGSSISHPADMGGVTLSPSEARASPDF